MTSDELMSLLRSLVSFSVHFFKSTQQKIVKVTHKVPLRKLTANLDQWHISRLSSYMCIKCLCFFNIPQQVKLPPTGRVD